LLLIYNRVLPISLILLIFGISEIQLYFVFNPKNALLMKLSIQNYKLCCLFFIPLIGLKDVKIVGLHFIRHNIDKTTLQKFFGAEILLLLNMNYDKFFCICSGWDLIKEIWYQYKQKTLLRGLKLGATARQAIRRDEYNVISLFAMEIQRNWNFSGLSLLCVTFVDRSRSCTILYLIQSHYQLLVQLYWYLFVIFMDSSKCSVVMYIILT
jgi:hypothetical protein